MQGTHEQRSAAQQAWEKAQQAAAKASMDAATEDYRRSLGLPSEQQVQAAARARDESIHQSVMEHLVLTAPDLAKLVANTGPGAQVSLGQAPPPAAPPVDVSKMTATQKIIYGMEQEAAAAKGQARGGTPAQSASPAAPASPTTSPGQFADKAARDSLSPSQKIALGLREEGFPRR